jgi:hypothetical protein
LDDDLDTIRRKLDGLAASAKLFLARLPIIKKRNEWRLRATPSLSNSTNQARRFTDEQDRAISGYYEQFDAFAQNWYRTLQDHLKGIVPQREYMEWVRDTNPSAPGYRVAMTCNAVLRAKEIMEDLYRCRDLPRTLETSSPERKVSVAKACEIEAAIGREAMKLGPWAARQTERYPARAAWLRERLAERDWNEHDVESHNGPDHKTTKKVLDGFAVREGVLEKITAALSQKYAKVELAHIPQK